MPDSKALVNRTIELEKYVKGGPPRNIFAERKEPKLTKSQRRLREQCESSLHPGHHENLDIKIKQLDFR